MVQPVRYLPGSALGLDPYALGLLLGDGSFRGGTPRFTKPEPQLHAALRDALPGNALTVIGDPDDGQLSLPARAGPNPLTAALRDLGLWGVLSQDKFVPSAYLLASPEDRLALVQGLLDTDGWTRRNDHGNTAAYFATSSGRLCQISR